MRSGRTVSDGMLEDKREPIRESIGRRAKTNVSADFVPVGARDQTPAPDDQDAQKQLLFCR